MFCLRSFLWFQIRLANLPTETCRTVQTQLKGDQFWPDTINNFEPVSTWWANYLKDCLQNFTPFQNQNHQPCRNISPITSESFCRIGTGWPWLTNCYLQILRLLMCRWCGTKRNELTARRLGRHTDKQECRWGGCRSECGVVSWLLGDREQVAGEAGECGM